MNPIGVGILGIILLLALLILGMPIAFVMMLVGVLGISYLTSIPAALPVVAKTVYETVSHYPYTIIPLFVLMGGFAGIGGLTQKLFIAFDKWFRNWPGGLGIATIFSCAFFAALSGSSVAAAAAMGSIAIPEMRKFLYAPQLAVGVVAAGGTLSFLIPPSLGFVVYGVLTEQSIGKLFISGLLPGILLTLAFIIVIIILVRLNPTLAPMASKEIKWKEKISAFLGVWETLMVFTIVIGGIYLGVINPPEAGALGATILFLIILCKRKLTWPNLSASLLEAARISVLVLFLVAGANVFSYFLALTTIPMTISNWLASLSLSRYFILTIIVLIYLLLGCFLDAISMMVLTMPVIFPVISNLGFDPLWFGVICVIMMEAGLITPPVGLNIYTIAGVVQDVPMPTIFKGALPFLWAMLGVIIIITIFPQIALFLPSMMAK